MTIGLITKLAKHVHQLIHDAGIRADLANPAQGAGVIKFATTQDYPSDSVGAVLKGVGINPWVFSNLITNKPDPTNYSTWDWEPAIKAAILLASTSVTRKVVFPKGMYSTSPVYITDAPISDVEILFQGSTLKCIGARTKGTRYDWEYGVLTFHGADSGTSQTVNQVVTLPENTTDWAVTNSGAFATGDYWIIEIDPANDPDAGGNFSTKKVWRLLQCTSINSATSVSFDYTRVFPIASGTVVKFTKVNPVKNVHVKDVELVYDRAYIEGDPTAQLEASSGVAFYKAVNCTAENVTYRRNPKQAAHFEFSHGCKASGIVMLDPVETTSGGYCVQFEKSIYFEAKKCRASKDRHMFDATASSNGKVTDCSGYNSTNSTFTTHGTWEHDIEYIGNSGHFQLAGSGTDFGQTSLRIVVRDHVGTVINAVMNVYDLTIENSRFTSISNINVDGLRIINSEFLNDVRLTKVSSLSKRESMAEQSYFKVGANFFNLATAHRLTMIHCTLPDILNGSLAGVGQLYLLDCICINTGTSNAALAVPLTRLEIRGGLWHGLPLLIPDSATEQTVVIKDVDVDILNRPNTLALLQTNKLGGSLAIVYAPRRSKTTGRHITALNVGTSAPTKIMLRDAELVGGTIQIESSVVAAGWLMRTNMIYNGCIPTLPAASTKVAVGTELTL